MFKTGSLRPRLILIVGLALAPLALASIGRGILRLDVGLDDAGINSKKTIVLVLGHAGNTIASSQPVSPDTVRTVAQSARNNVQRTFVTTDSPQGKWRWVVQPAGSDGNRVALGKSERRWLATTPIYFFADVLLPVLMILFAWIAIWLGTEWLVIRWTTHLKRISVAYGRGHFIGETAELAAAPEEFQLLGREMAKMARSIQARDLKLNQALRQEKALAREIHHRVKNNLQIVSSLINLYARNIADPAANLAFREIVARVDALSLVHRLIEKNGAVPVIAMKALFSELADQIRVLAETGAEPYRLELDVDECQLPVDVATPIALFAVEALSFGLHAPAPTAQPVRLSFRVEDAEHLLLCVENPALTRASLQGSVPSSARILGALCEQMRGRMWMDDGVDESCRLLLRVHVPVRLEQDRTLSGREPGWGEDATTGPVYDERQKQGAEAPGSPAAPVG